MLIFGDSGLYWECQGCFRDRQRETLYEYIIPFPLIDDDAILSRLTEGCSSKNWGALIQDYTTRSLTFERDRLPALSGLAKLYQQYTKHDYLAGLWRQSLLTDLMWRRKNDDRSSSFDAGSASFSKYMAPSWSWASYKETISYRWTDTEIKVTPANVINAQKSSSRTRSRHSARLLVPQSCFLVHSFLTMR